MKRQKEALILSDFQARRISEYVGGLFNNEGEITPITDIFPELFVEEKRKQEEEKARLEMELYKAKMIDFAYRFNANRR